MAKSSEEILTELYDRIGRLDSISEGPRDVWPERLRTWKEATVTFLREHVSGTHASRLEVMRGTTSPLLRHGEPPVYVVTTRRCRSFLVALAQDIKEHPDDVIVPPEKDSRDISIEVEGIFVAGQAFDAWKHLDTVFLSANKTIEIVDGWIGLEVLHTLSEKPPGVSVAILTQHTTPKFLTAAKAFQTQHGQLEIRSSAAFHDRFVIIDSNHFFHFGASLKDLGKKVFMFSRIEEKVVTDVLRDAIDKEWRAAPPIPF